jgi:hypothetical protein
MPGKPRVNLASIFNVVEGKNTRGDEEKKCHRAQHRQAKFGRPEPFLQTKAQ